MKKSLQLLILLMVSFMFFGYSFAQEAGLPDWVNTLLRPGKPPESLDPPSPTAEGPYKSLAPGVANDMAKNPPPTPGGDAKPEEGSEVTKDEGVKTCKCDKEQNANKCQRLGEPQKVIDEKSKVNGWEVQVIGTPAELSEAAPGKKSVQEKKKIPDSKDVGKFYSASCKPIVKGGRVVWQTKDAVKIKPGAVEADGKKFYR